MSGKIWLRLGVLAVAVAAQIFALRLKWTFDTQTRPDLQKIEVRSGYSLLLDDPGDRPAEPLLQYQASSTHNHRVTLEMSKAKLSKESRTYISQIENPPEGVNQLTYAPDPSEKASGAPCRAAFLVEFPPEKDAEKARSVRLYPPTPDEFTQPDKMRVIHLEGSHHVRVRVSTNSKSEKDNKGPGCRPRLTFGKWEWTVPADLELALVAEPDSRVTITLSPDPKTEGAFRAGSDEVDSLMIKPMSPRRLSIGYGDSQPDQVRERAGEPFLTIKDLALKGDSFELELAGLVGIPIPEVLSAWKWFLLAGINLPLLLWTAKALPSRRRSRVQPQTAAGAIEAEQPTGLRVFLSYSWEDKDTVMEIYELLKSSGADPWIDREKIRGGTEWELSIKEQMRASQRVIVFLSCDSVRKAGFAWAEIRMAVHIADEQPEGTAFIIPARLDECKLPDLLSRWNCIDLFRPDGKQKLLQSLGLATVDRSSLVQRSGQ